MGQINFLVTLLSVQQLITKHFPPSLFGTSIMGADQLDQLPHIILWQGASLFYPSPIGSVSWRLGRVFCGTGSEVPVSIIISVRGVVPMEVSSSAN